MSRYGPLYLHAVTNANSLQMPVAWLGKHACIRGGLHCHCRLTCAQHCMISWLN